MAGFRQFFTIFLMEFINIGPVYIRGWVGGAGGGVGGGKSLLYNQVLNKIKIVVRILSRKGCKYDKSMINV